MEASYPESYNFTADLRFCRQVVTVSVVKWNCDICFGFTVENLHVMYKFLVFDDWLEFDDMATLFGVLQLLNPTPVGCVSSRNFDILNHDIKVKNISAGAEKQWRGRKGLIIYFAN